MNCLINGVKRVVYYEIRRILQPFYWNLRCCYSFVLETLGWGYTFPVFSRLPAGFYGFSCVAFMNSVFPEFSFFRNTCHDGFTGPDIIIVCPLYEEYIIGL